jgi:radical SAM/Cys-rich protein
MDEFARRIALLGPDTDRGIDLGTVLVSLTLRCNQTCRQCQMASSPSRDEMMSAEVMERVVEFVAAGAAGLVDLTGGAPELNPGLPDLVRTLRSGGRRVRVRTNLTVLAEPGYEWLSRFFAEQHVELLASMPCYTERNVRALRGGGVHGVSVDVLRSLNDLGYGAPDTDLRLDLVYNPVGTNLPEPQAELEEVFRQQLSERFGLVFNGLITMTNMPVGRLGDALCAEGAYDSYVSALKKAFNPDTVPLLSYRHQIEIGWDGRLYDCDFNHGAGIPVTGGTPSTVWDYDFSAVARRRIAHADHCFGCTAGRGSS